ncbi:hypothetical protein HK100_008505 [Physocladia obscura]|uniref:Uncharacterized protein n=1 Tax=Physocladia obscura TaxID=109957 RepID=A0AAD5T6J1_9FUNG|nr:hypothetical protein HK100_008505 [Physocladia obscura]
MHRIAPLLNTGGPDPVLKMMRLFEHLVDAGYPIASDLVARVVQQAKDKLPKKKEFKLTESASRFADGQMFGQTLLRCRTPMRHTAFGISVATLTSGLMSSISSTTPLRRNIGLVKSVANSSNPDAATDQQTLSATASFSSSSFTSSFSSSSSSYSSYSFDGSSSSSSFDQPGASSDFPHSLTMRLEERALLVSAMAIL